MQILVMSDKRISLWDNSKKEEYTTNHNSQVMKLVARSKGEHTASNIGAVLANLSSEEMDFVQYLILSKKNTVVARYDKEDALFPGLVEKGLLQLPTGVGTVSLLKLTTTFRVPIAVWKALNKQQKTLFAEDCKENALRLGELENQFKNRLDVLVESEEIASKVT